MLNAGFAGQVSNNYWNELAIVCGMYESQQQIGLHVGYALDAIINCYYK